MTQTAVAKTEGDPSLRALAHRHGLASSSALPPLPTYIRQLWAYRYFITSYAQARTSSALGTTHLGQFWQVLTPLFNAAVYYLVFAKILHSGGSTPHFIPYLCTGVFIYSFTAASVTGGASSIVGNLGIIRALQFPRASLPVAVAVIEFRNLVASMSVLMTIVLLAGLPITLNWLLIIPSLALQMIFNVGLSLFCARLTSKIIDFKQILPFIMRIWMYMSATFYPVTKFTTNRSLQGWKLHVLESNPLLIYIEVMRHSLIKGVVLVGPPRQLWISAIVWAAVAFTFGLVYFWRGEKGYARG